MIPGTSAPGLRIVVFVFTGSSPDDAGVGSRPRLSVDALAGAAFVQAVVM